MLSRWTPAFAGVARFLSNGCGPRPIVIPANAGVAPSPVPLNQLDRVAVGVGEPRGAQLAVEKIMGRREEGRALCDQISHRGIDVVGPENDLDRAAGTVRAKSVMRAGRLDGRDAERKAVELELDMARRAGRRRAERLVEAEPRVKPGGARQVARIEIDLRRSEAASVPPVQVREF